MAFYYVHKTEWSTVMIEADSAEEAEEIALTSGDFDVTSSEYEVEELDV